MFELGAVPISGWNNESSKLEIFAPKSSWLDYASDFHPGSISDSNLVPLQHTRPLSDAAKAAVETVSVRVGVSPSSRILVH